jgi:LAS superfamily LD-carboxypeptidase LdcB
MLLALVAATGVLGATLAGAGPALALGPLPACRYDDILTAPRGFGDWQTTLVDTILRVPKSYVPPDLTWVSEAGISGTAQVRALVIPDLAAMATAAAVAGNPIGVQSAYRSYTTQISTFQYWVNLSGYKQALLYSARPGHSEHQLGVAIDFRSAAGGAPWSGTDWGLSPAGSWMKAHAWEFGFVQSYPKGKVKKTCYDYESWHFRYVGRDEAAAIHASGLTIREYLWSHFTTTSVSGPTSPGSSPSPRTLPGTPPGTSPATGPSLEPTLVPGGGPADGTTAPSMAPVILGPSPGGATPAGPIPDTNPVGAWFGTDPGVLVGGAALLVFVMALVASLAMARRRGGAR